MKQLDTAIGIASWVMVTFGGPFLILTVGALATDNQDVMWPLIILGFTLTAFCALLLIVGAWIDGLQI